MEYRVRFTMPTKFVGADYEDEFSFEFDDDADDIEIDEQIQFEFKDWLDDIIDDMRSWAEYEIL